MSKLPLIVFTLMLSGCIALPIPHSRPLSPLVSGTVRDKATWQPIPMARVAIVAPELDASEDVSVLTDNGGTYKLQATRRKFWMPWFFAPALGICHATVTATAPGYKPATQEYSQVGMASGTGGCAGVREYWHVLLEMDTL